MNWFGSHCGGGQDWFSSSSPSQSFWKSRFNWFVKKTKNSHHQQQQSPHWRQKKNIPQTQRFGIQFPLLQRNWSGVQFFDDDDNDNDLFANVDDKIPGLLLLLLSFFQAKKRKEKLNFLNQKKKTKKHCYL